MSTTLLSTLTATTQSFNEWRRNTNKTTLSIGDLSTLYTTDGTGGDQVSPSLAKYSISSITAATWINNVATFTTSAEHNLVANGVQTDTVTIAGISPSGFNGTFTILSIVDDNNFKVTMGSNPGTYTSGGTMTYQTSEVITAINDLNTRKVKRTGDTIAHLVISDSTATSSAVTGALVVTGGVGISAGLNALGDIAFGASLNKFTVNAGTGNTAVAGTFLSTGNLTVGASKLTVAASTGNTVVAGTLNVSGASTLTSLSLSTALPATSGGTGLASIATSANYMLGINAASNAYELKNITAGTGILLTPGVGTLTIASDGTLPNGSSTNTYLRVGQQLVVGSWNGSGNTALNSVGTALEVRPATGVSLTNLFSIATTNVADGSTTILKVDTSGNLSVLASTAATNSTSGALVVTGGAGINGKLYVGSDFAVGASKLTVAAASGNTVIAGTLNISGTTTAASVVPTNITVSGVGTTLTLSPNSTGTISNCSVAATTLTTSGDVNVNAGKFTVAAATGNSAVSGTFGSGSTLTSGADLSVQTNSVLGASVGNTTTFGLDCVITTYRTNTTSTTLNQPLVCGLAATYQSVEFIIQAKDTINNYVHTTHILVACDGTLVDITEFGSVTVNGHPCATYGADVGGGNIRLLITPASANNTNYKVTAIYSKA